MRASLTCGRRAIAKPSKPDGVAEGCRHRARVAVQAAHTGPRRWVISATVSEAKCGRRTSGRINSRTLLTTNSSRAHWLGGGCPPQMGPAPCPRRPRTATTLPPRLAKPPARRAHRSPLRRRRPRRGDPAACPYACGGPYPVATRMIITDRPAIRLRCFRNNDGALRRRAAPTVAAERLVTPGS